MNQGASSPAQRLAALARLEALSRQLDSRWQIPGTGIRFGWDGLASLIPVAGDTATAMISLYLVAEARRLGASRWLLTRMAGNVGVDWLFGSVPLIGTVFDVYFKSNKRNMALLRRYLERQGTLPGGPAAEL